MAEHAPENAMAEPGEIARFYDRCSDLMRELLEELAALPDRPRPFPAIEDALGWPHRRIASVLGGACQTQSCVDGPAIASSSTAASRTVRAMGPCTDSPLISLDVGAAETRPRLVLMPNSPLTLDGMRIEPPPSLPGAADTNPLATAVPAPPLDPPADLVRSHGVRAGWCPSGSV